MPPTATVPTLQDHLAEPLRAGHPDVHGPLAVFPLSGPPARVEYVAFAQAAGRGVACEEVAGEASANDLAVLNGTETAVLLYEGEEVPGAQQNRAFDVSVLVPARTALQVPASCLARGEPLDDFTDAVALHEGQTGALLAVDGAFVVLHHVSRAEVFAALHAPLVRGYAVDALEARGSAAPPTVEDAQAFLGRVMTARLSHHDGIGLGRDVRFAERGLSGAGLVAGEELVQLTAFAGSLHGRRREA